jgi:hypothetical protein
MNTHSFAFLCLLLAICIPGQNGHGGEERLTLEERAMRVVENEKEAYSDKREAISFLNERKAKEYIPRLGKVLQGKYDVVALDILYAFAIFADDGAWPYIVAYEKLAEDDGADIPGKINVALDAAKRTCRPNK